MQHKFHKCDKENCIICSGNLKACDVCHVAEGGLPTECPGTAIPGNLVKLIYNREMDFINNEWIILPKPIILPKD